VYVCMKYVFILFLLLIPLAYADNVLEAKQSSLDVNANTFLLQMNIAINFSQSKSIDVSKLTEIKNDFNTKLSEALKTTSVQDFEKAQQELKKLANEFKSIIKSNTEEFLTELKSKIKEAKDEKINEKITIAAEKRKNIVISRINERTDALKSYIDEQEKVGKDAKIHKILLKSFQQEQQKMNSTEYELDSKINSLQQTEDVASGFWGAIVSLKNTIVEEMKKMETN
jgi:hypothetical protein